MYGKGHLQRAKMFFAETRNHVDMAHFPATSMIFSPLPLDGRVPRFKKKKMQYFYTCNTRTS